MPIFIGLVFTSMRIVGLKRKTRIIVIASLLIVSLLGTFWRVNSKNSDERSNNANITKNINPDLVLRGTISLQELETLPEVKSVKKSGDFIAVELEDSVSIDKAQEVLSNQPSVDYVEEDVMFSIAQTIPNDSYFGSGTDEQWGLYQIDAPNAWDTQQGSGNIVVAVLDTGIDWTHPDITAHIWSNSGESVGDFNGDNCPGVCGVDDDGDLLVDEDSFGCGSNGLDINGDPCFYFDDLDDDDDENGYNDDTMGWDFVHDNNNPDDDNGHGTHVGGIIGAVTDNSTGVAGTIWNVQIMPLKTLDGNGNGSLNDAVEALDYAYENGADIVNMSWRGSTYTQSLKDTLDSLFNQGLVLVAAAGNDNSDVTNWYPAGLDNVLTVGATDDSDQRASFSNYGLKTEISAPGTSILSLKAGGTSLGTCWAHADTDYKYCNGTSMATPFVAGAAALIWDQNGALNNKQVMDVILSNVDTITPDLYIGRGRLDLNLAVNDSSVSAGQISMVQSTVEVDNASPTVGDTVNITITVYDETGSTLSGRTIYVTSSRGGVTDTIAPSTQVTNGSGVATFPLESTTSGNLYLAGYDDNATGGDTSDDYLFTNIPNVSFSSGSMTKFGFGTISNQKTQQGFNVQIYAQDQYDNTVTSFGNTVDLTDISGDLSSSTVGPLVSGYWSGFIQLDTYQVNNFITAVDGGTNGVSNVFNVTHPNVGIASIVPNYSYNSGSRYVQNVTVYGYNFRDGMSLQLQKSSQSAISCTSINVVAHDQLTCTVNTNGKAEKREENELPCLMNLGKRGRNQDREIDKSQYTITNSQSI